MYEVNYCSDTDITFLTKQTDNKFEVVGFYFGECTLEDFQEDINNDKLNLTAEL